MDNRAVIQKSLDYIEENLQAQIKGTELADMAGFSLFHYYRLFQQATGMPVMQYILRRNVRIYDPCYAATAVLSERFPQDNWLETYRNIILGYDSVVHLTEAERKAIPYVLLANQFVCVAWFGEQDKYRELFETNKQMTRWLLEKFEELKDI